MWRLGLIRIAGYLDNIELNCKEIEGEAHRAPATYGVFL
jgi:hypothetical protein